jgi:hypothetical protein
MKIKTIPTEIDVLVHYSQTYPRLFILTERDKKYGVGKMWYFTVPHKFAMAEYIIAHLDDYDEMFGVERCRTYLYDWRHTPELHTPEHLLKTIEASFEDSYSHFQIFELDMRTPHGYGQEDAFLNDAEIQAYEKLSD